MSARFLPVLAAFVLAVVCADAQVRPSGTQGAPGGRGAARGQHAPRQNPQRQAPAKPAWAQMLAKGLPETTAQQLALDAEHRSKNPLGPVLSARLRWEVADANRCEYAKQLAESDLVRAGLDRGLAWLRADLPDDERAALAFARALTLAASEIPDWQVARLIDAFGPDDVVAIVHTVAYANFQDRIFLALGLTAEPGDPRPAGERLPERAAEAPLRAEPRAAAPESTPMGGDSVAWNARGAKDLRKSLQAQQQRTMRIPEPDAARLARLSRAEREDVGESAWGRVSMGYQPGLTRAWYQAMSAFELEADLDGVFAMSLFWVVTRTNECFY